MSSYQKFLRENYLKEGALLGSFNEDDKYVIAPNVLSELLKIKKLITNYTQKDITCHAQISEFKINFQIKYIDDTFDNKRYASLYIKEYYTSFDKKIELVTFVASFSHLNDVTFLDSLKKAFNLYTVEDLGDGKSIKDENEILESILNGNKKISQVMVLEMGNENRKYVNSVLKVLRGTSQFDVLYKVFKEKISLLKTDKNTAKYFNEVKKILDSLVMQHYPEFTEYTKSLLDNINKDYMQKYKTVAEKSQSANTATSDASKKKGGKAGKAKKKESKSQYKPFVLSSWKFDLENVSTATSREHKEKETKVDEKLNIEQKEVKKQTRVAPDMRESFAKSVKDKLADVLSQNTYETIQDIVDETKTAYSRGVIRDNKEKVMESVKQNARASKIKDEGIDFSL